MGYKVKRDLIAENRPRVIWDDPVDFKAYGIPWINGPTKRLEVMCKLKYAFSGEVWQKEANNSLTRFMENT